MKDSALDRLEAMGLIARRFTAEESAVLEEELAMAPQNFRVLTVVDPYEDEEEEGALWNTPSSWYDHLTRLESRGRILLRYQRRFFGDLAVSKPPVWAVMTV